MEVSMETLDTWWAHTIPGDLDRSIEESWIPAPSWYEMNIEQLVKVEVSDDN